jgi:hypothetical protein
MVQIVLSTTFFLLYRIFLDFFTRSSYLWLILGVEEEAIAASPSLLHPTRISSATPTSNSGYQLFS